MYPENIFNCAIPNKAGTTISTQNVYKYSPDIINFYKKELCDKVSTEIGLKLYPTDLKMPTSCAILIYEKENDFKKNFFD